MALTEQKHPFYKPLWVRVAIVAVIAGWLVFELMGPQSPLWIMLSGAALAYALWVFFITWPKD